MLSQLHKATSIFVAKVEDEWLEVENWFLFVLNSFKKAF